MVEQGRGIHAERVGQPFDQVQCHVGKGARFNPGDRGLRDVGQLGKLLLGQALALSQFLQAKVNRRHAGKCSTSPATP